jgi:hypothetical protein
MTAFLPPDTNDTAQFPEEPALEHHCETLPETHQAASDVLAELLAEAETMETSTGAYTQPLETTPHFEEPTVYEASETPVDDLNFAAADDNGSFFASASFDAMDGFGQVNGNVSLFDNQNTQDDFYLPPNTEFSNDTDPISAASDTDNSQFYMPAETEEPYTAGAYEPGEYETGEYTIGEYIATEADMPEDLADEGDYEMDMVALADDSDEMVADIHSYDMGHYDDPDEPAEAFVLGSEEPEPILSLEPETAIPDTGSTTDPLLAPSALYYPQAIIPEPPIPPVAEVSAVHSEATPPEPIQLPETSHPMSDALASAPPEPPRPAPVKPATQRTIPAQEYTFRKSNTSATPYSDSIADALQSFEQEVLLRDTRFLKQSINNLVEQYFAQQEPENEW